MKKQLLSLIMVCSLCLSLIPGEALAASSGGASSGDGIAINSTEFKDEVFRNYVQNFDQNDDGFLSEEERNAVKRINLSSEPVTSLNGISKFKKLERLDVAECNDLKCIDMRYNPALKELNFWEATNLSTLKISSNKNLEKLDGSYSSIKELDLSKNTKLKYLNVEGCYFLNLDVSKNSKLETLYCGENLIKKLDLSKNLNLKELNCWNNVLLESINLNKNTNLEVLDCSQCEQLTKLDLNNCEKLVTLECWSDSGLTTLDLKNNINLKYLDCSHNGFEKLDLSNNVNLEEVDCQECNLSFLDLSKNTKIKSYVGRGNVKYVDDSKVFINQMPEGFHMDKVKHITGGYYDESTNAFVFLNSNKLTYRYYVKDHTYTIYTVETTGKPLEIQPNRASYLGLMTDYGLIKATARENKQKGATYRFRYRLYGEKDWNYINTENTQVLIKNLEKSKLYEISVANVLGGKRSSYITKKIYTTRNGVTRNYMYTPRIEKISTGKGTATITARKIIYKSEPKNVKYRYAYRVKGADKWNYITSSSSVRTIKNLKSGTTYTFKVSYYYETPIAEGVRIYSKNSKYVDLKIR